MTHADTVCRLIDVRLTPAQREACRYLEMFGFRFAVDFGYENAIEKAWWHFENELPIFGLKH